MIDTLIESGPAMLDAKLCAGCGYVTKKRYMVDALCLSVCCAMCQFERKLVNPKPKVPLFGTFVKFSAT